MKKPSKARAVVAVRNVLATMKPALVVKIANAMLILAIAVVKKKERKKKLNKKIVPMKVGAILFFLANCYNINIC